MHNILIYIVTSCLYNDTSHVLIYEYVNFKIIFKVHFIVYILYPSQINIYEYICNRMKRITECECSY